MIYYILLQIVRCQNEDILYCRCGMDNSDPSHSNAGSVCSVTQYHEKAEGIIGNYTGIIIVNDTTCAIDRIRNPDGNCRKRVSAKLATVGYWPKTIYSSIEIYWDCLTVPELTEIKPDSLCSSSPVLNATCCTDSDFCNDETKSALQDSFDNDRSLKIATRVLYIILTIIIILTLLLFVTYRRNPRQVAYIFGACCTQWALTSQNDPNYLVGNTRQYDQANNRDDTANYSTNETYIHDPHDSGSGQGNTICTQRTIARQTRIIDRIGNGRYGTVFRAIYNSDEVAVKKFYLKEETSWSREVKLYQSQSLAHDNILRFIAADNRDNGTQTELWLITEFHERGSLFDYLLANVLQPELCVKMALSIASGVEHLHKEIQGTLTKKCAIAHRDIKSKNILVKNNLELCIADLGLACFCGSNQTILTASSQAGANDSGIFVSSTNPVGTVRYLAPEYLKAELFNEYLNPTRADIYSSALVFWELLNRTQGFYEKEEPVEYRQPYWNVVPPEPTIEDMALVVTADLPQRPFVPSHFSHNMVSRGHANSLIGLVELMRECWQERPQARLSALRLKKDLRELHKKL